LDDAEAVLADVEGVLVPPPPERVGRDYAGVRGERLRLASDHVLRQHINLLGDLPAASFAAACDGVMRH
jgi:hypothetical protein